MNYDSREKKYTKVKKLKTKIKKSTAKFLRFYNWDVKEIANILGVSPNRVYQYLRD
mgnify:CR=1 FL=1|jgi:predicted transcriptional regulator|tara:strand:- start:93 stop:260 length:168 start_codon:yes stop_codon:yes gene_type:complete